MKTIQHEMARHQRTSKNLRLDFPPAGLQNGKRSFIDAIFRPIFRDVAASFRKAGSLHFSRIDSFAQEF